MTTPERLIDAKELYVKSPEPVSLTAMAKMYPGRKGWSYDGLTKRCRKEKWVQARAKFWTKVEQKAETIAVQQIAKKKAVTLEELNDDATKRTRMLLQLNEKLLQDAFYAKGSIGPDGKKVKKDFFDMAPRELRTIQQNILEIHAALRLYANFDPDRPIEAQADNSKDNSFLDALFEPILGKVEKLKDAGSDNPPAT